MWFVQWRDPYGRTKQKKVGPSKKAAENFLRSIDTAIAENKYIDRQEVPKVLIKDFIDKQYRPWCEQYNRGFGSKKFYIKAIEDMWGSLYLDELSDKDLDAYRSKMVRIEKPVMFNRVLATLSHMYTLAVEYKAVLVCPVKTAKKRIKEKARLRYLTPEEVSRLLDLCPEHLRPIVEVALHTGMRKSEILSLRLGREVNLAERRITLGVGGMRTKNDEVRHIPLNETAYQVLARVAEGKRPGDYLFVWKGKRILDIKTSWSRVLQEAGIEDFHFHDLRHTFASNLVMSGVDLYVLRDLLGHKDIKMTQKYAHLSPDHRAKAVTVLDHVFSGEKQPVNKAREIQSAIS